MLNKTSGMGGIMFHDVNTDTVLWILPMRISRPKTLNDRYVIPWFGEKK